MRATNLPVPCPGVALADPWKWPRAGASRAHPLPALSVQFLVSGKLCFPWVTDG